MSKDVKIGKYFKKDRILNILNIFERLNKKRIEKYLMDLVLG